MNGPNGNEPVENNIIKGPWKSKRVKVPDPSVFELQQDMLFAEELCENVMVQVIYTLGENGIDIGDKEFLQDIAFVIEALKSTLYSCLLYTSPSPRDLSTSRMPSSA